ncbi:MAG: histidinol-phosphate aminotransferase [Lysobacterales bacterium]|jgi:histidinol-phosphate aminotransferase
MSPIDKQSGTCDVSALAAPGVRQLQPYLPGKPISELEREFGIQNIIKLASNENPLGTGPAAVKAMHDELAELSLYPDGGGFELKHALAKVHGLDSSRITLGNGSNDVLVLIAEAFLQPGLEAVFSQYCFAVYPIAVEAAGATAKVASALPSDHVQALGHDLAEMKKLVNENTRIVFIANPNNPTGSWLDGGELYDFLSALPDHVLVVVDEAYFEYSRPMGLPDASLWLDEFPRLIVTRTFSKAYGLAGIRIGYSLSSAAIADMLNRIRQPFNVNSVALAGAVAALEDQEFIRRSVTSNSAGLAQLKAGFSKMGLHSGPSAANFLLLDLARDAGPVNEALLRAGIIVRPVGNYGLGNYLRITVGTPPQNESLLLALADILSEGSGSIA